MNNRIYDTIVKKDPINKGLSSDKKYYAEITDGKSMFLRVSDIKDYDRKKSDYNMMARAYSHGVHTPQPVEFGICNSGKSVYSLSGWLDGKDVEALLPLMSEAEQYVLGFKAGETLRKIHKISEPDEIESWSIKFGRKMWNWLEKYNHKPKVHSDIGEILVHYLDEHHNIINSRPQTFVHGDYNIENIIVTQNGELSVIDFNSYNGLYGDPWFDLVNMSWMPTMFPHFYTGQIKGYFNSSPSHGIEPPANFWDVFTYYLAYDALAALTDPYGVNGIEDSTDIVNNIFEWTNNFKNPVPTWYLKDLCIQQIDGVPYQLEAPFDFSFLSKYGNVFTTFDEQGSGNIAFGVKNGEKKYFVKFAGAPKKNYIANRDSGEVDTANAIKMLKAAVLLYMELAHPTLIKFISAEEIGGGYAAVFEWENAIGIESHNSPDYQRFMQMPVEKKIQAFEDIMEFHTHVAAKGYVALDFYNGSILYDYEKEKVIICDIDLYQKSPFVNVKNLGIVGSARYVSPEECVEDAIMDEITNVYNMGATAFALFASGDRSPEVWTLSPELYDVVKKAVSDERSARQQTINELIEEWRAAK